MCQRTLDIHRPMYLSVITCQGIPILCNASGTVVAVTSVIAMLFHILDGCHQLKSRSRRIQSLCGTVEQHRIFLIVPDQAVPLLFHGIGIIIRLGDHRQDLAGLGIHGNHGTFLVSKCIIRSLLQAAVQCRHHAVSRIFLSLHAVYHLLQWIGMGCQQWKTHLLFNPGHALGGSSHHMTEYLAVGICPRLIAIGIDFRGCQNLFVCRQDISPHDLLRQQSLPFVVRVVDHCRTVHRHKPRQISDHPQKCQCTQIGDDNDLTVSPFLIRHAGILVFLFAKHYACTSS